MSRAKLGKTFADAYGSNESAPLTGADFSFTETVRIDKAKEATDSHISARDSCIDAAYGLQEHMRVLLENEDDWYQRKRVAAEYAEDYLDDLPILGEDLSRDEQSSVHISRVYLGAVSSLGRLGEFMATKFWLRKDADETSASKTLYLASRKIFQDDVDAYMEHFVDERSEVVSESLQDLVNMARILVNGRDWVNALTDTQGHIFLGSVLSERAVMMSLRKNVHSGARYGTPEEDRSPTKADVVIPMIQGNMYIQVKMKWIEPTELKVSELSQPMRVTVPMHSIRGILTEEEDRTLATPVKSALRKMAA